MLAEEVAPLASPSPAAAVACAACCGPAASPAQRKQDSSRESGNSMTTWMMFESTYIVMHAVVLHISAGDRGRCVSDVTQRDARAAAH